MVNTLRSPKSLIFTVRCTTQHKAFAFVLIFYLTKQTKDFSNKQNIKEGRVVQMLKQIIGGKMQSTVWKQAEFSVKTLVFNIFGSYQRLRATQVQASYISQKGSSCTCKMTSTLVTSRSKSISTISQQFKSAVTTVSITGISTQWLSKSRAVFKIVHRSRRSEQLKWSPEIQSKQKEIKH